MMKPFGIVTLPVRDDCIKKKSSIISNIYYFLIPILSFHPFPPTSAAFAVIWLALHPSLPAALNICLNQNHRKVSLA